MVVWSSLHRRISARERVLYLAVATREAKTTCTLHATRVSFPPSCLCYTVVQHHLDSPRHRLPLSSTRQVVAELGECRNRYCEDRGKTLVVDTITIPFHRLVVMPGACAREYGTQQNREATACAAALLFSAQLNACASHDVWKPKSRRQFRTPICPKMGPHFRVKAVPKMISEKIGSKKNTIFGSIAVDD